MDTKVLDWDQPLEAVHDDGRVIGLDRRDTTKHNGYQHMVTIEGLNFMVLSSDGFTGIGWHIRNVASKEVEWGPEIKVEGKRPEWLGDDDEIIVTWGKAYGISSTPGSWTPAGIDNQAGAHGWHNVYSIRLDSGSKHYISEDGGVSIGGALISRAHCIANRIGSSGMWHASSGAGRGDSIVGQELADLIRQLIALATPATSA